MALDPVVNFFRSTIATLPVASGGTSIVITTGDGAKLPDPAVDGNFNLTIYNEDDPFDAPEIVRVTAISGDTLTVTRAQEGTSATNKTSGNTWYLELTPTAKTIQDIDDKKLDVAGGTMTGDLTIPDKIIHSGDTNTSIRFPSADTIGFETDGSRRVTINSSGNVGIGTTTPFAKIHSAAGSASENIIGIFTGTTAKTWNGTTILESIRLGSTFTGGSSPLDNTRLTWGYATSFGSNGSRFGIDLINSAGNFSNVLTATGAGNVGIGTTSPATKLDVSGSIRASTGILFGTDTASANTLDDYEEGVWTPTVTSAGYTASSSSGSYTRVGRIMHIRGTIQFSAVDASSTSRADIGGLPFTPAETTAGWGREDSALGHLFAFRVDASITAINSIDGVVTASNVPFATSRTYIFGASYRV